MSGRSGAPVGAAASTSTTYGPDLRDCSHRQRGDADSYVGSARVGMRCWPLIKTMGRSSTSARTGRETRPAMGSGPADTLPVRLDPELRQAVDDRAAAENTTASDVVREALRRYLKAG